MNWSMFLFGVLPLIAFVVIDAFAGLKAGITAAVLLAVAEMIYSLVMFGEIDGLTIGSFALVAIFGYLSYRSNNPIFFKVQPLILGLIFAATLLVMQAMGKPLMVLMAEKYRHIMPEPARSNLGDPMIQGLLSRVSHFLGWGLLVHALACGYSAFYMSNWWWLAIRGVGLYVVMGVCVVAARLTFKP